MIELSFSIKDVTTLMSLTDVGKDVLSENVLINKGQTLSFSTLVNSGHFYFLKNC